MFRSYQDIIAKAGEPIWYDQNGVPRYVPFHPRDGVGVYVNHAAYMKIACQACKREFYVASEFGDDSLDFGNQPMLPQNPTLPIDSCWDAVGSFHYGDPPCHGCIGDSMNSVPLEIIQFWFRDLKNFKDWERIIGGE